MIRALVLGLFVSVGAYYDILLTLDHPCSGDAEYLISDKSSRDPQYGTWNAQAGFTWCLDPVTGFVVIAGYNDLLMQWQNNPFFRNNHFPVVEVSANLFTARLYRWLWKANLGAAFQTTKWDWGQYTLYSGALWGRYHCNDWFGLHIGFLAIIGIHKGFARPIVGFDYRITRKLYLKAVYPIDMSLTYCLPWNFSAIGAIRLVRERRRLNGSEPIPRGIFEYRSYGIEGRLGWQPLPCLYGELFIGSFLDGWIRVNNSSNGRITYHDIDANGYVGGNASLHF